MTLIVMKETIDYLIETDQLSEIDDLMGSSDDWGVITNEKGLTYYRKIKTKTT
tara:strand:+ start:345 stop:503 length:159 start_codon:yes stop_codon:yes gene_type:complete